MFERLSRSWELLGETWSVLRQDKALVVFPILSGICSLLVLASFLVPAFFLLPWQEITRSQPNGSHSFRLHFGALHYALVFLYYLASYFTVAFFTSGLVACVRIRLNGGTPTVGDGLSFACANAGRILLWALFSATVGTILKAIQERAGWLGQIVSGLFGLLWTLATTFVVPVLVYERVGPFEAVKRSAAAFRRTWGETVVANVGLGTVFGLLFLPGLLIVLGGVAGCVSLFSSAQTLAWTVLGGAVGIAVLYWIALSVIQSALQGIFLTACYEYATTGRVPSAFSEDHIAEAWAPR